MTPNAGLLPHGTLDDRLEHLHRIGSDAVPISDFASAELAAHIVGILTDPGFSDLPQPDRGAVLFRLLLIYSGTWDIAGRTILSAVEHVLAGMLAEKPHDLDAQCVAYDLLFFLYWCWDTAVTDQLGFGTNVVEPFAAAVRAELPSKRLRERLFGEPRSSTRRVGYLAEFVTMGPGNAIAGANQVLLRTLARAGGKYRPILYAWMFHDPGTLAAYEAMGVEVRAIAADSPSARIAQIEAAIRADQPDVLITDMNTAVPTVLFERRVAPIQVFYQFGLPLWPLRNIDGVFHVWDFDRQKVGFAAAICTELKIPYDVARFSATPDADLLAAERSQLPAGRLIGTYGRLAKVTPEFIAAVAMAIRGVPDVKVVLGGSGDAATARAAIAALGVTDRFVVLPRYVDGNLWGHILDFFLDTFPQPGGASCLEVIAKGKPVVSLAAAEAPNLSRQQRVPGLVTNDPAGYSKIIRRLLIEPEFYTRACTATRALAASFPTEDDYLRDIVLAIDGLRTRRRGPLAELGRALAGRG